MSKKVSLYMHGLGRTELRPLEHILLERNKRKGLDYISAEIDWCSSETFTQLLARIASQAGEILNNISDNDLLILEGSSAGGSLAMNVFKELEDPRVRAISHSGRLAVGDYSIRSWRNLARCAHLGTPKASQSFYDSVAHFETTTMAALTEEDKSKLLITLPLADEVVPVDTMYIDGVRTVRTPIVGHSLGIGLGVAKMSSLVLSVGSRS